jgi:hypothetical protein
LSDRQCSPRPPDSTRSGEGTKERSPAGTCQTREVSLVTVTWDGHQALPSQFLDWLDVGPPPETTLTDNLQSAALLFAAIQASETSQTVDVQAMVRKIEQG